MADKRSIKERLKEKGYIVTDEHYPEFRTDNRMIVKDGKRLGYYTPLKALNKFIKT